MALQTLQIASLAALEQEVLARQTAINSINNRIDKDVTTDVNFEADATTVKANLSITNLNTEVSDNLVRSLPIASTSAPGIMPKETFIQISQNTADIETLKQNQGGKYIGISFETLAELQSWTIPSTVLANDYTYVEHDETKDDQTTMYVYDGSVFNFSRVVSDTPIGVATKDTLGIVLSSEDPGMVLVESNGAMSLVGYDQIIDDIANNLVLINSKVSSNAPITAGTATKVTYDAKGLVTDGEDLVEADIPALSITKVTGLQTVLDGKASVGSIATAQGDITALQGVVANKLDKNAPITAGTATKITYDSNGLVTSGENLTAADIPEIAQTQVTGLVATLATKATTADLAALTATVDTKASQTDLTALALDVAGKVTANADITAGTGTKVTYDKSGLVTGSESLVAADIPVISQNQVSGLEASLESKASTTSVDALAASVETKVAANAAIDPGTGTKVTYDAKGLVTGSDVLEAADIPALNINKITGLQTALDTKLEAADISGKVDANAPITAGSAAKVTYDAKGLVTGSTTLEQSDVSGLEGTLLGINENISTIQTDVQAIETNVSTIDGKVSAHDAAIQTQGDDIATITSSLTAAETEIGNRATKTEFNALSVVVDSKVASNPVITAGTGTKITYDEKGLVTESASLAVADIPTLAISKISGLQAELDAKAAESTVDALQTTVDGKVTANSTIVAGTATKVTYDAKGLVTSGENITKADIPNIDQTQVNGLTDALDSKAAATDVSTLQSDVSSLQASKVTANADIAAGTGTKVTYDAKGLVTGSDVLTEADLPNIAISKVTNLQTSLDSKASTSVVSDISATVQQLVSTFPHQVYENAYGDMEVSGGFSINISSPGILLSLRAEVEGAGTVTFKAVGYNGTIYTASVAVPEGANTAAIQPESGRVIGATVLYALQIGDITIAPVYPSVFLPLPLEAQIAVSTTGSAQLTGVSYSVAIAEPD